MKTQVGGILGNRTEQPRSRHCCCGLAGLLVGQGCCRLARAAGADANGKVELVSGPIQPIDVLSSNGRRYFVEFNELHQPLRKGGHILVKFLGYIAKMGNYCPLGALTWHKVEKN
ncbi:putative serine/threonine-protein kinase BUD32-like protein [Bienertia sinuspersici]